MPFRWHYFIAFISAKLRTVCIQNDFMEFCDPVSKLFFVFLIGQPWTMMWATALLTAVLCLGTEEGRWTVFIYKSNNEPLRQLLYTVPWSQKHSELSCKRLIEALKIVHRLRFSILLSFIARTVSLNFRKMLFSFA